MTSRLLSTASCEEEEGEEEEVVILNQPASLELKRYTNYLLSLGIRPLMGVHGVMFGLVLSACCLTQNALQ